MVSSVALICYKGKGKKHLVCFCTVKFNLLEALEFGVELHGQCSAEYHKKGVEMYNGILGTKKKQVD